MGHTFSIDMDKTSGFTYI